MSRRRVAITGLGIISPVGNSVADAWASLLAGRSGIGPVTRFDASSFPTRIAGEVKGFDVSAWMSPKEARHFDTFIHYGVAASIQAWADSGLSVDQVPADRVGCLVGSGIGGLPMIEDTHCEYSARGVRRISPFFVPGSIINMISGQLAIMLGLKGPNLSIVTACTTGLHSIGMAARMIGYGDADVMLAGGAESTISPLGLGGFCAARALSQRNDDPQAASRPWDRDRDGFVLGEGAGVMVLEAFDQAKQRGAKIYAELLGFGMSGDANHITSPSTDGPKRCMQLALADAKLSGDAIKLAFGEDCARRLAINSTKSMTGHLLGGAGGIETVFTALAIHHQVSPPTINIDHQDPACDLDYVANQARSMTIQHAMKNSFGFGGTNGSLVLGRV
ncbi:MAG: beta-ketoacyl-[acyl-carrier-protein] synthase II [Betaproteobacteria bacterium]|nr:beta-ketoacyl-[acyl-carrier-protein] synthase II [Betaproteobacteria bacterium]